MTGLQAAREISRRKPDVRVLMLSMLEDARAGEAVNGEMLTPSSLTRYAICRGLGEP
jgi:DNA-binding NarL/FixJ family response regulator